MLKIKLLVGFSIGIIGAAAALSQNRAAKSPSYANDVAPVMKTNCAPCHFGSQRAGGLRLESVADMLKGGGKGPAIKPGKASESLLIQLMEHTRGPQMPPIPNSKPLPTKALRAWIDAGAKEDSTPAPPAAPMPAKAPKEARITSVAYSPDGKLLAVGKYREIQIVNPATGAVTDRIEGLPGAVTSLAFNKDSNHLVAASGIPGKSGSVFSYVLNSRKVVVTFSNAADMIQGIAVSPDGTRVAGASYDKMVYLWSLPPSSAPNRTLKDHTDSVYGVAFNKDGTLLASCGADRTVKVWDVKTGKRLYTVNESTAELYTVAFSPDGTHIAAGGVDKTLRTWKVTATGGKLEKAAFAHDGAILRVAYTSDGADYRDLWR